MTWLILIFLEAQTFCETKPHPPVACIDAYVECVLDDNKNYCVNNFYEYYEGI